MQSKRVALIAVHGVADQQPGDTARSVVELLVASAPKGTTYTAVSSETITLPVDPLEPKSSSPQRNNDSTPKGEDRSAIKAFVQSGRSDFQRQGWEAPDSLSTAWPSRGPAQVGAMSDREIDRGIAATDYLLTKHRDNGAQREAYETTRIVVERTDGKLRTQIDVFEMYWADLSRLSGAIPRIITELFTMVFRLSKLGRETVDEARGYLRRIRGSGFVAKFYALGWWLTAGLQIVLDWLFVNGLALLFVQLSLLAIVLIGLGLASAVDPTTLHRTVSGGVAIVGLLLLAYRYRDRTLWVVALPLALIAAGLLPLLILPSLRPWITVLLLLGAVTFVNEAGLRVADDRFPFVRSVGRWLWIAVLLLMLESARRQLGTTPQGSGHEGMDVWVHAALFATEVTLLVVKWWWVVVGPLLVVWLVSGWVASFERGYESKASIATGRLGLSFSIGAFLVMTMAIWALLSTVLDAAVKGVAYSPCVFAVESAPKAKVTATAPVNACLWTTAAATSARAISVKETPTSAQDYLNDRYRGSTAAFSMLAAVILCLVVFLATMFAPSVLAEMKVLVERTREAFQKTVERRGRSDTSARAAEAAAAARAARTRRLGRWLTTGYRSLDGVVHAVFGLGILLGLAVALIFAGVQFFSGFESAVSDASQRLLKPLVIGAAGVAASLILLGGLLSKYLPAVRAPLDIALDVDNHFREFPRTSIPRARIFSRYAALLKHVAAGKYDRIVIVSHSQGTVISAELLRFLSSDGKHSPPPGDKPRIDDKAIAEISLLTLGCPLRQLYAARFPTLYRWVILRCGTVSGPRADDVGVERWVNAFCSGDYVGRWLWSDSPNDGDAIAYPMVDTVDATAFGRIDAYAGFDPMPPAAQPLASTRELEVCLGLGAHTHYFDRDQVTVAWLIDYLVGTGRGGDA